MTNRFLCYNRLWKLLIDKNIKKKELCKKANISATSLAKLKHNENVNTNILMNICNALECDVCDIVEMVQKESNE